MQSLENAWCSSHCDSRGLESAREQWGRPGSCLLVGWARGVAKSCGFSGRPSREGRMGQCPGRATSREDRGLRSPGTCSDPRATAGFQQQSLAFTGAKRFKQTPPINWGRGVLLCPLKEEETGWGARSDMPRPPNKDGSERGGHTLNPSALDFQGWGGKSVFPFCCGPGTPQHHSLSCIGVPCAHLGHKVLLWGIAPPTGLWEAAALPLRPAPTLWGLQASPAAPEALTPGYGLSLSSLNSLSWKVELILLPLGVAGRKRHWKALYPACVHLWM